MPTIGISLIAHNEEAQVARAIESALFADEIVVVNCASTDRTVEQIKRFPRVRLFSQPNHANLNVNKSFGFDQLTTDWIFYLDPDEQITESLAHQIRETIGSGPAQAYQVPRRNVFFGRWLEHGGQYPDRQLRLFQRGKARFPQKHVHESLEVDGKIGDLSEPFDHFPYPSLHDFLRKMNFYTSFQAGFWREAGMKSTKFNHAWYFFLRPASRFLRRYVLKGGFLDGWQGFLAAFGDAFQIAVSYGKFLEKEPS